MLKVQKQPTIKIKPKKSEPAPVAPEPADVESIKELDELKQKFRDRDKSVAAIRDDIHNTEMWDCIVWDSSEQRQEFLRKAGLLHIVKGQYIEGAKLARMLGIKLETPTRKPLKLKPCASRYRPLIREHGGE